MHQALFDILKPTTFQVFQNFQQKYPGRAVYGISLYTNGEYSMLMDTAFTEEGLREVAESYLQDEYYQQEWGSVEVAMRELKWSPCDSPHHGEFEDRFEQVNAVLDEIWANLDEEAENAYPATCQMIHETAIAVLQELRNAHLFPHEGVVYNLLMGDQSDEERYLNSELVNPLKVLARFRTELLLDEDELHHLRENRWNWEEE